MSREKKFNPEIAKDPKYKSLYEILGIGSTSTNKEIKAAFKRRATETHPDKPKNKGKEQEFLEIKDAFDILTDKDARKNYDKTRREDVVHPHFSYQEADWSVKRKVNKLEKAMKELDAELLEELRDLTKNPERHKERIQNFEAYANTRREELRAIELRSQSEQENNRAA